jgi:hypothetical protein
MTLTIDRPGGANGANIAWHPVQKKYYAAMAGNIVYPFLVFDATGNKLSPEDLETMFDVRGLWYNPTSKTLQANGYNDFGWSEYRLNEKGIPVSSRKLTIVTSQPDAQSVGVYDPKKNMVYFLDYKTMSIEGHEMKNGSSASFIQLHLRARTSDDINDIENEELKYDYNENAIVFSGIKSAEVGLLNVASKQIELYDISTGLLKQTLILPEYAPANASLNFCFSNGIYWLFDKGARIWHGYK